MNKRVLGFLLMFAMVLTIVPMGAFALETPYKLGSVSHLQAFEAPVEGGALITMSSVSYLPAPACAIDGYEADGVHWFKSGMAATVTAPEGYTISKLQDGTYGTALSLVENQDKTVYLKRKSDGAMTDAVDLSGIIRFDAAAPTGTLALGSEKSWTGLTKQAVFELFFKENQSVTVAAVDAESGVKSIEYYVADQDLIGEAMSDAQAVSLLEQKIGTLWVACGGEIPLVMNKDNVVYVRLTDNVGNVSYLSSDGIVLDGTAPKFYGIEDGGTYYGNKIFKAFDDRHYPYTLLMDGVDVTDTSPGDDEFALPPDNKPHTLVLTDKAGNTTTYTVTVNTTYTIRFDGNGGEGSMADMAFRYDETQKLTRNTFTREGYDFVGWENRAAQVYHPDQAELENLTTENGGVVTLYAMWQVKTYTVTYYAGGQEVDCQLVEHGRDATAPAVPEKEGYTGVWDHDGKNITADTVINAVYTPIAETPQTGDPIGWAAFAMLLSAIAMAVLLVSKKRIAEKE